MKESNKSLSSILDWGHEGHIREVLQEDGCLSMYKYIVPQKEIAMSCLMFIFRKLKINHEFILEFSTAANTYDAHLHTYSLVTHFISKHVY
jgi:hypothetical protein